MYIGVIKDDVYRAKGCDLESFKKKLERSIRLSPGFTKQCENPSETNRESTELTLTTAGFSNNGPNPIKKIFSDVTPGDVIGNDTITNCYVSGSVVKANDVSPNDVMDGDTKVSDVGDYRNDMVTNSLSTISKDMLLPSDCKQLQCT